MKAHGATCEWDDCECDDTEVVTFSIVSPEGETVKELSHLLCAEHRDNALLRLVTHGKEPFDVAGRQA